MTPEQIARLRELEAAMTPGDWRADMLEKSASVLVRGRRSDGNVSLADDCGILFIVECAQDPEAVMFSAMIAEQVANAQGIVAMRNAFKGLLDRLEEVERERDVAVLSAHKMRSLVDEMQK